jgi:hypothetical protein
MFDAAVGFQEDRVHRDWMKTAVVVELARDTPAASGAEYAAPVVYQGGIRLGGAKEGA